LTDVGFSMEESMAHRSVFLGSVAAILLAAGTAGAQTSVLSGGGGTGGGTASAGTSSDAGSSSPTQLLPEDGAGSGSIDRTLSGSDQQTGGQSGQGALDAAGSPIEGMGADSGPIATTPSPMNAPSALSGTGGSAVLTPTPMNAPRLVTVPALSGNAVPQLGGAAGTATAVGGPSGIGMAEGGLLRSNARVLGPREAAQLRQQLQAGRDRTGAQVIILSGSVFQGTTDRPNVVVAPRGLTARGDLRGLSTQTLRSGQPVLRGTVEAPRVIAFAPAPGNVLVVQGSQLPGGTAAGQAEIRAQIVELPAE
jgi:hypothetical protein